MIEVDLVGGVPSSEHGVGRSSQVMFHLGSQLLALGLDLCNNVPSQYQARPGQARPVLGLDLLWASWMFLSEFLSQLTEFPRAPFCLSIPP